jgi:ankyrin repeat protein
VVKLLLERGADPVIATRTGWTPLMEASSQGHLEVVRVLLGHPSAKATINHHRDDYGRTALWWACFNGRGEVVRELLENGADPTIASNAGITPVTIAKGDPDDARRDEGRRECVAALEVRSCCSSDKNLLIS